TTDITATLPQITAIEAVRTSSAISIRTTGYSAIRSVTAVSFSFEVRTATGIKTVNAARSVDGEFTLWFKTSTSADYGSGFAFTQSFSVQGDISTIEAVTVTLTNSLGSTASNRTVLTPQ